MRYFLDTEFNERGPDFPIELISMAVVCETGEFYSQNRSHRGIYSAVMNGATHIPDVDPWLIDNVYKHLFDVDRIWRYRHEMRDDLIRFFQDTQDETPMEIWGYFADYDWVLFSQTFGRMIDVQQYVSDMPMHCKDLKQRMGDLGVKRKDLDDIKVPTQVWIDNGIGDELGNLTAFDLTEHNALYDAFWNSRVYDYLQEIYEESIERLLSLS